MIGICRTTHDWTILFFSKNKIFNPNNFQDLLGYWVIGLWGQLSIGLLWPCGLLGHSARGYCTSRLSGVLDYRVIGLMAYCAVGILAYLGLLGELGIVELLGLSGDVGLIGLLLV